MKKAPSKTAVTGLPPICLKTDAEYLLFEITIYCEDLCYGDERNNTMKKTAYGFNSKAAALLMSSAMLISLTACTQPVYRLDPATTTATQPTGGSAVTSVSGNDSENRKVYAYSSLLACLENVELKAEKYDWMIIGHEDSNWLFPTENTPCALADLTGDGIEELIVMEGQNNLSAVLEVYSYNESEKDSKVILTVDSLNMQAEAARGVVVGTTSDGKLVIIDCPRNQDEYITYIVYSFNGKELVPSESAVYFVSYTDDASNSYKNYKVNDNGVSEQDFNAKAKEIISSIDCLYQYAFVCGDSLKTKVSSLDSKAMSYQAMHEYLKGKIN